MSETDGRTWGRPVYVAPHLPDPVQRSVQAEPGHPRVPRNARVMAGLGPSRVTYAIGYEPGHDGNVATRAIMEPTGEETPTGRPAMKEVGSEPKPAQESIRVVVRIDEFVFVGHWLSGGWDCGMVLRGRTLVRNVNWTQLREALKDAASQAHLRGETPDGQLPLTGHDGQPV